MPPSHTPPALVRSRCARLALLSCLFLLPSLYLQQNPTIWTRRLQNTPNIAATLHVSGLSLSIPPSPLPKSTDIAVCITGHLRSFHDRTVHASILDNAIKPLNGSRRVDIFFHIGYGDVPRPGTRRAKKYNVRKLIAGFKPVSVTTFRDARAVRPAKCEADGRAFPFALLRIEECLDVVRKRERKRGALYDWVYKTRPDIAFAAPISAPGALSRSVLYMNQHDPGTSVHAHEWLKGMFGVGGLDAAADHVLVASREVAEVAFQAVRAVENCRVFQLPSGTVNSEVLLTYWLVRHGVRYEGLPWVWLLVRDGEGVECWRLRWVGEGRNRGALEEICGRCSGPRGFSMGRFVEAVRAVG